MQTTPFGARHTSLAAIPALAAMHFSLQILMKNDKSLQLKIIQKMFWTLD
jgi:hypothetical protein